MKKRTILILLYILSLLWMSGCSTESDTPAELAAPAEVPAPTDPTEFTEPPIPAVNHLCLGIDDQYMIAGEDLLLAYYEEPIESFISVCNYYEELDWTLYKSHELNGNHFATYTNANELAHIYWIACKSELNVVLSSTGGHALPPADPEVKTGSVETTITQLKSSEINGMGYVIQLADGSFLVIDGGYASCREELWSTLVDLNNGEENILIRAWLLTHSHNDHYGCFSAFSTKYGSKVTLETLMISPINDAHASTHRYLSTTVHKDLAKFDGARLLYVHTGMVFQYCDVTLEILYTADEFMISEPVRDENYAEDLDFNSSSIISRIYTDDCRAIFLADCTEDTALRLSLYYGEYLRSEMCQASHHGVEDCPFIVYQLINPSTYWFPCNSKLFEQIDRHSDIRAAIISTKSTAEIILHDQFRVTRPLYASDSAVP